MKKRASSDPWRMRLITLDRAASALEASAELVSMLDEETAYREAAAAVRTRMKLPMVAIEEEFHPTK